MMMMVRLNLFQKKNKQYLPRDWTTLSLSTQSELFSNGVCIGDDAGGGVALVWCDKLEGGTGERTVGLGDNAPSSSEGFESRSSGKRCCEITCKTITRGIFIVLFSTGDCYSSHPYFSSQITL